MLVKKALNLYSVLLCIITLSSCVEIPKGYEGIPPGEWRGVLKLGDEESIVSKERSENVAGYTELPFNFYVVNTDDSLSITFRNAKENITVSDITIGLDRATAKDTIIVNFAEYDTYLKGVIEENIMEGHWYVNYKEGYSIPFIAFHGKDYRFINHNPQNVQNFDGKWDVTFDYDKADEAYKAIGHFKQDGNKLSGTFQTETGDYRFLEGDVLGKKMKLSVFDGSHAFYFEAKQLDGELVGVFKSGKHYTSNWIAKRNKELSLGDPFMLTKTTQETIDWNSVQFIDNQGKLNPIFDVTSTNPKLINIMGTWCPNCKDEMVYLKAIKKEFSTVECYSVCYERYKDNAKNLAIIAQYQEAMDISWPMFLGGRASKKESSEDFPFLSNILSYPTLLVLDSDNTITAIHTGFNGPATDDYSAFDKQFKSLLQSMINE